MKNKKIVFLFGCGVITLFACTGLTLWAGYLAFNSPSIQSSLQQLGGDIRDMAALQQQVAATYPAQAVQVNTQNGHILTVSLVNSEAGKLPATEANAKAREIAQFVRRTYAGISRIDMIRVTFITQNQVSIITTNQSATFSFNVTDLGS